MVVVTQPIPIGRMSSYEEEDFGIVPLGASADSPSRAVINDCFLGASACAPSPLFKRRISNASLTPGGEEDKCSLDNAFFCDYKGLALDERWLVNEGRRTDSTTETSCDTLDSWKATCESAASAPQNTQQRSSWIEEWMDMNGIFDPTNDNVVFTDMDLPLQHPPAVDQIIPTPIEPPPHPQPTPLLVPAPTTLPPADALTAQHASVVKEDKHEILSEARDASPYPAIADEEVISVDLKSDCIRSKSFVLRPVPKETVELISAVPLAEQHRSEKVIKASYAIDSVPSTDRITLSPDLPERAASVRSDSSTPGSTGTLLRSTGSRYITEKKRQQNRSAAIRYRDRRREEAKLRREELHELELRNVALNTQVAGLNKEIAYLRTLLDEVL